MLKQKRKCTSILNKVKIKQAELKRKKRKIKNEKDKNGDR